MSMTEQQEVREELDSERYRLVKMQAEQISRQWPKIKEMIRAGLGKHVSYDEVTMANILQALLVGRLECWCLVDRKERKIVLLGTTTITVDTIAGDRNLLIYSMFSESGISLLAVASGLAVIKQYAKSVGCNRIIGAIVDERFQKLASRMGADTSNVLVSLEV